MMLFTNVDSFWLLWLIRLLVLAALAVSVYLLIVSLQSAAMPAGCGAGSGCATVLTSRWAGTFGIPVSAPAAAAYAAALIATFFIDSDRPTSQRRIALIVLAAAATAAACAAIWFISLQVFVIKAVCPWCMGEHALGFLFALATFVVMRGGGSDERRVMSDASKGSMWPGVVCGLVMTAVLVAGQLAVEYKPATIARLPAGQNADSGPGAGRVIQILDGAHRLSPHEEPLLGSPDAKHVLIVVFDYCCPHCRATHAYLLSALERYPDQLAVLALPMPMNHRCNRYLTETEARFEHACELATLALAVWKADRAAFVTFDSWLFESEMPRDPDEAKQKAGELVGSAGLTAAMDHQWLNEQIDRNVDIYHRSGAERIPVILGAKLSAIVGEPDSAEQLFGLLETELGMQADPLRTR
jgi:uncharacterized membrane protein